MDQGEAGQARVAEAGLETKVDKGARAAPAGQVARAGPAGQVVRAGGRQGRWPGWGRQDRRPGWGRRSEDPSLRLARLGAWVAPTGLGA